MDILGALALCEFDTMSNPAVSYTANPPNPAVLQRAVELFARVVLRC